MASFHPTHVVIDAISRHVAGEIVMSDSPGRMLRKWREVFGASQLEVARRMGITASVISDYEKGRRVPGSGFVKRFVEALVEIDAERGWPVISKLSRLLQLQHLSAVVDMMEFERGVSFDEVVSAVKGVLLNSVIPPDKVYGYTVVDSIMAIESLSGNEFVYIMGSTSQRVLVFTRVTTGRSPLIAVRVAPIKPAVVVIHRPRMVDFLAVRLAEMEGIPLIASTARSVEELVSGLRRLASSREYPGTRASQQAIPARIRRR
ncbi:MAG: helix-turn-helix domain-containing protein [Pyrodictiaceae archaeon]